MLDIRNFTRNTPPRHPYAKLQEEILPGWDISLVFAGTRRAQALNVMLRQKDYTPNVLSYETSISKKERSGEIIICPEVAKRQCAAYGLSYSAFVALLCIHGMLHLNGSRHGTRMEHYEREYLSRFIGVTTRKRHGTTDRDGH